MFAALPFVTMNLVRAPYNLPFGRPHMSNDTVSIRYLNLNEFHYAIRKALSNQHSLSKFDWDEKSKAYKVEYGTRPLEYDNIEYAGIIQRKRFVAERVAIEALKRFPHNRDQENFDELLLPISILDFPRKWSKFELRLFWNHQENCLQLCGQRLTGDRMSYGDVWKNVERYFGEIETRQYNLLHAVLEENLLADIDEEYMRDYLVCDLI